MSEPYMGEIKIVSFNFAPKGWAVCNGQVLPISQNQALFSLLGTTFGGDGRVTFALPNLQGRAPVHMGNEVPLGQSAGEERHTLTIGEMPGHAHPAWGTSGGPAAGSPVGNVWATLTATQNPYSQAANATMVANALQKAGGGQPHANMQPYLVLTFVIALQGIFPSRN
jgi:microcystin-dependent protein